jgi:hypothetical protein
MCRYLVDRVGLENAAKGMVVKPETLELFVKTGELKSNKITSEVKTYFFDILADELDNKNGIKNYDDELTDDLKTGKRKGGAGGGSNNGFSTSVSDTYL